MNTGVPHPLSAEAERKDLAARFESLSDMRKQSAANWLAGYICESFRIGIAVDYTHAFRAAVATAEGVGE